MWVESFLREEGCADTLGPLIVAEFEGDKLLQTIEIAIDCCVVPSCRDEELYPDVDVVVG